MNRTDRQSTKGRLCSYRISLFRTRRSRLEPIGLYQSLPSPCFMHARPGGGNIVKNFKEKKREREREGSRSYLQSTEEWRGKWNLVEIEKFNRIFNILPHRSYRFSPFILSNLIRNAPNILQVDSSCSNEKKKKKKKQDTRRADK